MSKKFIIISQVFPPDPAAVGQYFEDVAIELAQRGHEVVAYTANRDYDNPKIKYESHSRHPNVKVIRLPFSSFGKRTMLHRLLGQISFLSQILVRLLFCSRPDGVVLTTIPATTGVFFLIAQFFRRFQYLYWVMDINPDQAVALGAFGRNSLPAHFLTWVNGRLVNHAQRVVCLDTDMTRRLGNPQHVTIIPPWPLEGDLQVIPAAENSFIAEYALVGKFVFMYSGNHSLVHPLTTLLDGVEMMRKGDRCVFAFIGGGRGKAEIEERVSKLGSRLLVLPYQPLERIKYSLSAADVQVVSFGDEMLGIVHPCKFYSALAMGQPILLLGLKDSPLGKIVVEQRVGWCVAHGDAEGMARLLESIIIQPRNELKAMGDRAKELAARHYSRNRLRGDFCDVLERSFSSSEIAD
ncbi:glycosyltransferase family 4 protein [Akkermansiaceae bacterium]|nr:glycosyltransferase family 4 protein [Akkermansiaceae bacterium]MDA7875331.1 glycosyltransferase family 4 protein [Akkermansiaceae bacterium]MDC0301373.1 glycosyltransferase family 4 protein [Akkermansiaceae bacterium]